MDIAKLVDDLAAYQIFVELEQQLRKVESEAIKIRGRLEGHEASRVRDAVEVAKLPAGADKTKAEDEIAARADAIADVTRSWDERFKVRNVP